MTAERQYDAFGNLASSSGSWQGAFGYGGDYGYQKDANGLHLLGHRYYDSSTGRFTTNDPAHEGRNWYAYVSSSPVFYSDPTGLVILQYGFGALGGFGPIGGWLGIGLAIDSDWNFGITGNFGLGVGYGFGGTYGSGVSISRGTLSDKSEVTDDNWNGWASYRGAAIAAQLTLDDEAIAGGGAGRIGPGYGFGLYNGFNIPIMVPLFNIEDIFRSDGSIPPTPAEPYPNTEWGPPMPGSRDPHSPSWNPREN